MCIGCLLCIACGLSTQEMQRGSIDRPQSVLDSSAGFESSRHSSLRCTDRVVVPDENGGFHSIPFSHLTMLLNSDSVSEMG